MRSTESKLHIENLDVYYGQAHALQGVSLSLGDGVLAVVGRNGMGKTTLCKAIVGMVPAKGSIHFAGSSLLGLSSDQITRLGVAYVPQGRRVWRSLTVDETLRLASKTARQGAWTVERVYQVFPRLAERRNNGGAQLSGGEQQMLAIGRALLFNPSLLVMDEPTEGLAPVIVEQVATLLKALADERSMSVLLIEQNLGVALEVADHVAIMVNGRIAHTLPAAELAADRALQQRLLGLKASGPTDTSSDSASEATQGSPCGTVMRVVRMHGSSASGPEAIAAAAVAKPAEIIEALPPAVSNEPAIYLAGDWESQRSELGFVKRCLEQLRTRVVTVGLDRALCSHIGASRDLAGLMVVAPPHLEDLARLALAALPLRKAKLLVSSRPVPGLDAGVLNLTASLGKLNPIAESLLATAASAIHGASSAIKGLPRTTKPLVCITALDLVSPAVRHVQRGLGNAYDCLVLDMASEGSATLAQYTGSGLVAGIIDLAPVDVSAGMAGGSDQHMSRRFDAMASSGVPYVLVPSLLEVATFAPSTPVPVKLLQRDACSSVHDGSIVPISRSEADAISAWLSSRLNAFTGPVHLSLSRPTTATLDRVGGNSQSVAIGDALNKGLLRGLKTRRSLQVAELPHTLNDVGFGESVADAMKHLIHSHSQSTNQ